MQEMYEQGESRAQGMAAQAGRQADTKDLTDARELHEWMRSNDKINVQALLDAGASIEDITRAKHPNRVRLVLTHSTDWSERVRYAEKMKRLADEAGGAPPEPVPTPSEGPPAPSAMPAMAEAEPPAAPATNGAGY